MSSRGEGRLENRRHPGLSDLSPNVGERTMTCPECESLVSLARTHPPIHRGWQVGLPPCPRAGVGPVITVVPVRLRFP